MTRLEPGSPETLGVTAGADGANVAVWSAHATAIELCLFDAAGETEVARVALPERTGDVFHAFVPGIAPGSRYGLRAHGPWDPRHGHRFNPAKLLVDPYATALDRRFALHPSMFGQRPDGRTRNDDDSAPHVPKAIVAAPPSARPRLAPPVPWERTVVYELHVRGFTRAHAAVPEAVRGTCAALAHPAAVAHLANLGVTTVELMPIAAWVDERHLAPLGLTNYWGYNPVAFMAPDPLLAPGGMAELAACVAALHGAGIEVLLDVVLNHTGEGDEHGPTLSLRGLDNASYYRARHGDASRYADDAGCGNTLALDRPAALRLAMDALRHYAIGAGVDGFRFDLATTLARRDSGFDPAAPFLQALEQDPALRGLKLVAEPWDLGPGGHRLGAFPAGWGEWNDRYRDTVRRFWRGDEATLGDFATRVAGSADAFARRRRPPSRSVNFVCAHDGFTLADLVSHGRKHNEANGESNRDGTDANHSWNHGCEGPSADADVREARMRDARALLATLFLSRGTPLVSMGDELGRTQRGNNNAYAQDGPLSWIDWASADEGLARFVAALARLRREHRALHADRWLAGEPVDDSGIPDVEWRRPDGRVMAREDWEDRHGRVLVAALHAPASGESPADRVAIAFNGGHAAIEVRWPDAREGFRWRRAIDTAADDGSPVAAGAATGTVAARAVVMVVEEAGPPPANRRAGVEPAVLDALACAAGIEASWRDVKGVEHAVGEDTRLALLESMGLGCSTTQQARERLMTLAAARECRRLPRVVVCREGEPARLAVAPARRPPGRTQVRIAFDDGEVRHAGVDLDACPVETVVAADGRTVARRIVSLPPVPTGACTVTLEGEPAATRLFVVPRRCHLPPALAEGGRRFGLAAHLYALRRPGDQGIGDFTTLAQAALSTARAGGATVGINPLHALFAHERDRASPYHPSDRRFLDPIYLDVAAVPDLADSVEAGRALERAPFARLAALPSVDYAAVWSAKREVLSACFEAFARRPAGDPRVADFRRFVAEGGDRLRLFAAFEAIAESRPGVGWPLWPAELRRPGDPGVARFAARHAREVDFAIYLQWLADRQLASAARSGLEAGLALGFYRDLAVGAAPDGAEAWSGQAALARGASTGAPPDAFCPEGQVWNLPPPLPEALAAGAYEDFRALVAANMRHAGALRLDHAMGLSRLFWVPDGAPALEGAYVRYPFEDLLGVLALESRNASCLVVGEDLGTVPVGFRERLEEADVLSYRVLWFERDGAGFRDPCRYPAKAAACVSTHDLPTIRGWWDGFDIDERRALGLAGEGETEAARSARGADRRALLEALHSTGDLPAGTDGAPADLDVAKAMHRRIGRTACALALLQADDLAGETTALNLPGTDRERPNWRRRVGVDADSLWETPVGSQAARDLAAERGAGS